MSAIVADEDRVRRLTSDCMSDYPTTSLASTSNAERCRPLRILIATYSGRRIGGTETYLEQLLPALEEAGHSVACLFETNEAADRPKILVRNGLPIWSPESFSEIQAWKPDVVFAHGFLDTGLERRVQSLAPAVLFAHGYYGTCGSGTKAWAWPTYRSCQRSFGLGCLIHYYPHRCGGLNPLTMIRTFSKQQQRHRLLGGYRAIITGSRHMEAEFRRHASIPDRVQFVPYPIQPLGLGGAERADRESAMIKRVDDFAEGRRPARLLLVGRLEPNKGVEVAIKAARTAAVSLNRPIELTIAGEGSERARLEPRVTEMSSATVRFVGWLTGEALAAQFARSDLLVVPSLWPEPFGLVGLEAAQHGVPSVAFAHGGITDWLIDGQTGALAGADPPGLIGMANAITRCLTSATLLGELSTNALASVFHWPDAASHVSRLSAVFQSIVQTATE